MSTLDSARWKIVENLEHSLDQIQLGFLVGRDIHGAAGSAATLAVAERAVLGETLCCDRDLDAATVAGTLDFRHGVVAS